MTNEERAGYVWRALTAWLRVDRETTLATVTHWLEYHGAGLPDVPLMQDRVRDDAKIWAASASQFELEAYMAAAVMQLERSPLTDRASKRITAMGFKNMSAESCSKFKEWVGQQ